MKISIGSDHGGYELKEYLKTVLVNKGIDVDDVGCFGVESVDYPIYAKLVAKKVATKESEFGVLICKSGIGMSVAANKIEKIRAALCLNEEMATLSKAHTNSNILVLGSQFVSFDIAEKILDIWLTTAFDGGRHERRISEIENDCDC